MITPSFAITATERVLPKLALDFTTASLDPRITFTRAGNTATVINSSGVINLVNADIPRFDYNATTLACQGLLIEESRTNTLIYSIPDAGTPTGWTTGINSGTWTRTLVSGFGILTGFQNVILHEQTVSGRSYLTRTVTLLPTTTYCVSLYVNAASTTYTGAILRVSNFSGATSVDGFSKSVSDVDANGRVRVIFTTSVDVLGEIRVGIGIDVNSTGTAVYSAWQLEAGAFPTSYIPTEASQVTRNADVATMTGTNFSDWYNAGAGGVVARVLPSTVSGTRPALQFDDTTANEIITLQGNTTNPELAIVDGGSPQAQIDAGIIAANTVYSLGAAWNTDNCAAAVNGGAAVTDNTATIPTVTQARLGSNGTDYLNGHIQTIRYWPQRIINAEVQAFSK
jgi:hypothetical protein